MVYPVLQEYVATGPEEDETVPDTGASKATQGTVEVTIFVVDVVVVDVVVDAVGTGTHAEEYIVVLTNTGIPQVSMQPQKS